MGQAGLVPLIAEWFKPAAAESKPERATATREEGTPTKASPKAEGPGYDPFMAWLDQVSRQAGLATTLGIPPEQIGRTLMGGSPMSGFERLAALASLAGNALPWRGGVGAPRQPLPENLLKEIRTAMVELLTGKIPHTEPDPRIMAQLEKIAKHQAQPNPVEAGLARRALGIEEGMEVGTPNLNVVSSAELMPPGGMAPPTAPNDWWPVRFHRGEQPALSIKSADYSQVPTDQLPALQRITTPVRRFPSETPDTGGTP